jgi:phosphoribosyl-AMP cyclohydrolase
MQPRFDPRGLKYNDDGLIPAIAQDAKSGDVLMMAWMNIGAVERTIGTGKVTYWSRSRQEYWVKGATSGNTQKLVEFYVDCDRDCLLLKVEQIGPACHTNRPTCFYTQVSGGKEIVTQEPV